MNIPNPWRSGEPRYDLESRTTVASNDMRSYRSHKRDPAVGEHSAEGKPGMTVRARYSTDFTDN